jgi:serine protease Do
VASRYVLSLLLILVTTAVWVSPAVAASLPDFTGMVEQTSPVVVNISTSQKIQRKSNGGPHGRMPDFPEGTPFDDFLRRFPWFDEDGERGPEEFDSKSLGSGFIVSDDGYILTNHHVIKDADEIIVRLNDRRELEAEVVGSDPRSDVALLKIDAKGLPTAKIGDSSKLKVGEWVVAIGSPFDFDHTVTAGIVSALGRNLPSENYVPFIQTDVAINPGNSGGPLLNMDGEVVGINAQIYSRTGGFMGLSFTIPINLAMNVVDQLQTKGHVARGWLGVFIQDVTRELAESFGMEKPGGALVSRVMDGSPAEDAGYKVGDVIIEFDGKEVISSATLPPMVGATAVDKTVPVKVIRDGKKITLDTRIGELPAEDEIKVATAESKSSEADRLGLTVGDLTDEQRSNFEIEQNGVIVEKIERGPALRSGIREGDVILKLNNVTIKNAEQFAEVVEGLPTDKNVAVLVQRRSGPIFLAMKLEEAAKADEE